MLLQVLHITCGTKTPNNLEHRNLLMHSKPQEVPEQIPLIPNCHSRILNFKKSQNSNLLLKVKEKCTNADACTPTYMHTQTYISTHIYTYIYIYIYIYIYTYPCIYTYPHTHIYISTLLDLSVAILHWSISPHHHPLLALNHYQSSNQLLGFFTEKKDFQIPVWLASHFFSFPHCVK